MSGQKYSVKTGDKWEGIKTGRQIDRWMSKGEGTVDRSTEERQRSLWRSGALLALCEERRMTCFPFEVLSM